MYSKIVILCAALAAVSGQHGHEQHGHAVSSQSIVRHDVKHEQYYAAPTVHHAAPAVHHTIPVVHHAAPIVHHAAPVVQHTIPVAHHESHEEHYAHPKYEFSYSVNDPHTHDIKSQHESRDGDVVKGYYTLHEADGTVRIVEYTANKHSGFNAVVRHEGHATHAAPQQHHH